jgi:hypothetical protein
MKLQKYRVTYTYIRTDVYEIEADSPHTAEEHASDKGKFIFEHAELQSVEAVEEGGTL